MQRVSDRVSSQRWDEPLCRPSGILLVCVESPHRKMSRILHGKGCRATCGNRAKHYSVCFHSRSSCSVLSHHWARTNKSFFVGSTSFGSNYTTNIQEPTGDHTNGECLLCDLQGNVDLQNPSRTEWAREPGRGLQVGVCKEVRLQTSPWPNCRRHRPDMEQRFRS